jgi:hypothetical protein
MPQASCSRSTSGKLIRLTILVDGSVRTVIQMSNARPISYYRVDLYFREDRPRRKLPVTPRLRREHHVAFERPTFLERRSGYIEAPDSAAAHPLELPRPSARAQCGRSAIRLCNARAKRHGRRVLARMATGTRRKTVVGRQPAQRTQRENPLPRARAIMLARSSNSIGHQPPALVSMRTRANARRISSR